MPAVLLVILWWKRGRIGWADVRPLLPFFAVGLGFGMLTVWMEKVYVGAQGERFDFTVVDRLLIAGRAVWFYAGKLAWPYPLMFFYPRWTIDSGVWWQYVFPLAAVALLVGPVAGAAIASGAARWLRRSFLAGCWCRRWASFDVFPFRFSFVADHYQYHASIALITLGGGGLDDRDHALCTASPLGLARGQVQSFWFRSPCSP